MTRETEQLEQEIQSFRETLRGQAMRPSKGIGYNTTITILTDLLGCIFVGCAVGLFLQRFLGTSVLLTAGLTLLGGVAGLYTTTRYALRQERHDK